MLAADLLNREWGHTHDRMTMPSFALESGEAILDFDLSYAVQGRSDELGSNIVLVTTSLGSNHHRLDYLIEPGRSLDPARWLTIAVDAIGNGRTTSPSTSRRQPGSRFPVFTIRDMVRSQILLLDQLGISRVRCVIGASMGGMQALEWARMAPSRVDAIIAMTPLVKTPPWTMAMNDVARYLFALAARGEGDAQGHALGLLELIACSTPDALDELIGDQPPGPTLRQLRADRERRPFSGTDWIAQSRAYDSHDMGTGDKHGVRGALSSIGVPTLLLTPPLDLFNPISSARLAAELMPSATLIEVPTSRGHSMTNGTTRIEADAIDAAVAAFLR